MRASIFRKMGLPAAIVIVGFIAVFFVTEFTTNARPQLPDDYQDSDLTVNGSKLKGFAFGMEGLIADFYYMRSLQYLGDKISKSKSDYINFEDLRYLNPRLFYPLLKNATDIDPHYIAAYSYGAIVLPAIDSEKAVEFATKGIENNPNEWRLYQHLGYIYWRLKNYEKASEIYEMGSRIKGAAGFMKVMAAAMKTEGGSRDTARAIYTQMLQDSDDWQVRITAERRLMELDSLEEREVIDLALEQLRERSGQCANSLNEVVPLLINVKLPHGNEFMLDNTKRLVDPSGSPYLLDKENCRVKIDIGNSGLPSDSQK